MKKQYSTMETMVIPVNNDMVADGSMDNCIIITELVSSDEYNRCDLTDESMVQREWVNNNTGLQVTLTMDGCY